MHAVSLILHARCMRYHWHRMHKKFFEQLRKVKILCKTSMVCKKKLKCMRCQWRRMHDRRTIRTALAALKGISIKNIYVPELSYPTTKKIYININWLAKNNSISVNSKQNSKGFSPWIRGPGGIAWWKKPRVENLVTLSLYFNIGMKS
jgi:hypothetical protein